ncbi:Ca2+ sensor [Cupriavidus sp. USMAA2-4]|uniref:Ca2+ sensor n=1 Tax=Cupriavidus malaysiensis TaxID=367825 RepID=A0ABN4TI23_9BURK|nr:MULTISPECIES: EF-hand domain-containing protein [Cupriavidus]AOY92440.1 Ca2+ sensor [Cupriavidus sp. USMAA2-4]AOZ04405.1 Ca2+ sensor [Cupriavidus malaysiensis]
MQGKKMKQNIQRFLAASAVFLVTGAAFAQSAVDPAASAADGAKPMMGMDMGHHRDGLGWLDAADANGDGAVTKAEFDALFRRIDTNHDGKIDKAEAQAFRKAMWEQRRAKMEARFEARFKAADKNGDGALTREEVQAGLPRLAPHFDQLDANHDGKLTLDEIRAGMRKMHEARMQRWQHRQDGGGQPVPGGATTPSGG